MGRSVAGGDVNGDGISDLVVGASGWDDPQVNEGAAFLWLGSAAGLGPPGTPANAKWRAEGDQDEAIFGWPVRVIKDFNGDGYGDVIVGGWEYDRGQTDEGAVFVWYGGPNGLQGVSTALSADWIGEANLSTSYFGYSAADAGDVNGDGVHDLVVGAYYYPNSASQRGRAFVFLGSKPSLFVPIPWPPRFFPPWIPPWFQLCIDEPFGVNPIPIPGAGLNHCQPDPICPQCWKSFDGRTIDPKIAGTLSRLYASIGETLRPSIPVSDAWLSTRGASNRERQDFPARSDDFARLRKALFEIHPVSINSKALRDSALTFLEEDQPRKRIRTRTLESVVATLNAATVEAMSSGDIRVPVPAAKQSLVRAGVAALSFRNTTREGMLSIHTVPGLPAGASQPTTPWPVAHFVMDYSGALDPKGMVTIDFNVRALGLDTGDHSLRLLEWDGRQYRDITVLLDNRGGTIRGVTNRPRTYVIATTRYDAQK
jgi:hypothetical protein